MKQEEPPQKHSKDAKVDTHQLSQNDKQFIADKVARGEPVEILWQNEKGECEERWQNVKAGIFGNFTIMRSNGVLHTTKVVNGEYIRLASTENKIHDQKSNTIKKIDVQKSQRKEFKKGQEVYVLRSDGTAEKGWIIVQGKDGKLLLQNVQGDAKTFDAERIAHIHEVEDISKDFGTMPREKAFQMLQRMHDMLNKNATLTAEQCKILFNGNFRQGKGVGDCYLIAAFHSVKHSPHMEALMRTSIHQEKNGDFIVKLPLGGKEPRTTIKVTVADLQKQAIDATREPGKGTSRHPVQGSLGWQVLEAAYGKVRSGELHSPLDRTLLDHGYGHEALVTLFGRGVNAKTIGKYGQIKLSDQPSVKQVSEYLDNFNNGKDIATINSVGLPHGTHDISYKVKSLNGEISLSHNHAYSIESVNKFTQTVVVKNPHDTSQKLEFSYDQLQKAFTGISAVQIDFTNFFPS